MQPKITRQGSVARPCGFHDDEGRNNAVGRRSLGFSAHAVGSCVCLRWRLEAEAQMPLHPLFYLKVKFALLCGRFTREDGGIYLHMNDGSNAVLKLVTDDAWCST